ncbi:MAG: signal recognition particle-docking protein FtsY [Saprospiraceae bacterium]|nr:signal recognition particle-docking protein FtsY [Saprospiraceae bacterium]HMW39435.1 signal recognition particle-docking protein FtsY [Saprospiraceae bacterium]HMX87249.1 signal recognition particle-docking protein FtsY [Saprospiraceae bacterium]HMZ38671.1 signal recognition particle-docking protein FtsY [Saprospiraceae bacterium]HNA64520.1 signal recognition particle-docking protein FtsY [Saprospiraceae bacterium]
MSLFDKLKKAGSHSDLNKGLENTKRGFFDKLARAVAGKSRIDEDILDELEQVLISSDVGLDTTVKIIDRLAERVARDKYLNTDELAILLKDEISKILLENNTVDLDAFVTGSQKPYVILIVGVNGVGKTTSIGKLAYQFTSQGKKVMIAAGDTFRAAAEDQLKIWSERVGCTFFTKGMGTDPSAVAFEATQKAISDGVDVLLIDTAGRLHTKINLMNELGKIERSIQKSMSGAPHEVLQVLDATTGQNAIEQCRQFSDVTKVTGLILTKLDGSAKGGVVFGISDQFKIPIKYIGLGERIDQLQTFNRTDFINAFFSK